jgi:hypothetical protein
MTVKDVLLPEYPANYVCFSLAGASSGLLRQLVEALDTERATLMTDEGTRAGQTQMGILRS